ncbi:hypothetical protein TRIP_B200382 [uncultured Desulfatiglans sp.]|uniref:Uncharacterized protein n=1 Tax=Uncultured Desulfatiglans sp. TaxID=1748965 RepID=A0A653A3L3_UNCDX|nr:hypothetical protein TRIP_B200382 [uncultured Desulfatiglans sp.]
MRGVGPQAFRSRKGDRRPETHGEGAGRATGGEKIHPLVVALKKIGLLLVIVPVPPRKMVAWESRRSV